MVASQKFLMVRHHSKAEKKRGKEKQKVFHFPKIIERVDHRKGISFPFRMTS